MPEISSEVAGNYFVKIVVVLAGISTPLVLSCAANTPATTLTEAAVNSKYWTTKPLVETETGSQEMGHLKMADREMEDPEKRYRKQFSKGGCDPELVRGPSSPPVCR